MTALSEFISARTPPGWQTKPLWSLFRRQKITGHPDEELLSVYRDYGVIPKSSRDDNFNVASEDLSGYQLVTEGCLVTNKMKAWQGSIAISRHRGIVSPAYYVYRPLSSEHDQFLHYLLRSEPYIALYGRISKGVRVNQWDLEHEALRNIPVMLPDIETQKAIADFLDRETARIDQLIEKKRRQVELLSEKDASHVTQLLGTLPQTTVKRLKHVVGKIEQGWSPQAEDRSTEPNEWGVLKLGAITTGIYIEAEHKALPVGVEPDPRLLVARGDVLVARASGSPSLVGKACYVAGTTRKLILSDKHFRLTPRSERADREYLVFVLNSTASRSQLERGLSSAEGMARNIPQGVLLNVRLPLPNIEEQKKVVAEINRRNTASASLRVRIEQSVERIAEYRAALITAAVTGQITVTNFGRGDRGPQQLQELEARSHHEEACA